MQACAHTLAQDLLRTHVSHEGSQTPRVALQRTVSELELAEERGHGAAFWKKMGIYYSLGDFMCPIYFMKFFKSWDSTKNVSYYDNNKE